MRWITRYASFFAGAVLVMGHTAGGTHTGGSTFRVSADTGLRIREGGLGQPILFPGIGINIGKDEYTTVMN